MNAAMNQPSILTLRLGQSDQAGQRPSGQAVVNQARKRSRPSGFDPSR